MNYGEIDDPGWEAREVEIRADVHCEYSGVNVDGTFLGLVVNIPELDRVTYPTSNSRLWRQAAPVLSRLFWGQIISTR